MNNNYKTLDTNKLFSGLTKDVDALINDGLPFEEDQDTLLSMFGNSLNFSTRLGSSIEKDAHLARWVSDMLDTIYHVVSIRDGDFRFLESVVNLFNHAKNVPAPIKRNNRHGMYDYLESVGIVDEGGTIHYTYLSGKFGSNEFAQSYFAANHNEKYEMLVGLQEHLFGTIDMYFQAEILCMREDGCILLYRLPHGIENDDPVYPTGDVTPKGYARKETARALSDEAELFTVCRKLAEEGFAFNHRCFMAYGTLFIHEKLFDDYRSSKNEMVTNSAIAMKLCRSCNRWHPRYRFVINLGNSDGYHHDCRTCQEHFIVAGIESKIGDVTPKGYARKETARALSKGLIPNSAHTNCHDCGNYGQHWHHPNYDEPFHLVPLCTGCHGKRHRKERGIVHSYDGVVEFATIDA